MPILTLANANGWWLVDLDAGTRSPLVAWALLEDPGAEPYVVGTIVDASGRCVEVAAVGAYVPTHELPRCSCRLPDPAPTDPGWCKRCPGVIGQGAML